MRLALAAGLGLVLVLAALDGVARAVDGDLAVGGTLPRAIAATWPAATAVAGSTIVPRRAAVLAAVRRDDLVTAERLAGGASGAEADDLRGIVAEARHDDGTAADRFVAAGDLVRAQTLVDRAEARGDVASALALQTRLVARSEATGREPQIVADAWWRLGQLRNAAHHPHEALAAYRHALALDPNEETYLLALGEQALENGDVATARDAYARASAVVPGSVDAIAGAARAAALAGDCAAVRADLVAAERAARHARRAWPDPALQTANPANAAIARCAP